MRGPKLRELGALEPALGAAPERAGAPDGVKEGRDGGAWNDLPPKDGGLEGAEGAVWGRLNEGDGDAEGADRGWLKDGLGPPDGRLNDGLVL